MRGYNSYIFSSYIPTKHSTQANDLRQQLDTATAKYRQYKAQLQEALAVSRVRSQGLPLS